MVNCYYLAPFVAVVFFLLLGFFICFYYYKPCKRKEEDEVVNMQRRQQLNAAADCDFVEKNRLNSAVKDYFVVVHLWCMYTNTDKVCKIQSHLLIIGNHCCTRKEHNWFYKQIRQYYDYLSNIPIWVDGASLDKTMSKGSPKRIYRSHTVDAKRHRTDVLWALVLSCSQRSSTKNQPSYQMLTSQPYLKRIILSHHWLRILDSILGFGCSFFSLEYCKSSYTSKSERKLNKENSIWLTSFLVMLTVLL